VQARWHVFQGVQPDLIPAWRPIGVKPPTDPMEIESVVDAMSAIQTGALLESLGFTVVFGELNALIPRAAPRPKFFTPEQGLNKQITGESYVAYLLALECAVRLAEASDAFVVNMSFGLDPSLWTYDPDEPFNLATRTISARGGIVVAAAGNFGQNGLSPWSRPPWVLAVGACTASGEQVEPYSSIGNPEQPQNRPWVVAHGELPNGKKGTSFAAPRVALIARIFSVAVAQLARISGWPAGTLSKVAATIVRNLIAQSSKPLNAPVHAAGSGRIEEEASIAWISSVSAKDVSAHFPQELVPVETAWRQAVKLALGEGEGPTAGGLRPTAMMIDQDMWWSRNATVPGFWPNPYAPPPMGYTRRRSIRGRFFDTVGLSLNGITSFELDMNPVVKRGKFLRVGPEEQFQRIGDALAQAKKFDVIHIMPGTYTESLVVPSNVAIVGTKDQTRLTHPTDIPLVLSETRNVHIEGLIVDSPERSALGMLGAQNVGFEHCMFSGSRAISVVRSSRITFRNCLASSPNTAIYLLFCYDIELWQVLLRATSVCVVAFGSAVDAKLCEFHSTGTAILTVPPGQPWPELCGGMDRRGNVSIHDLDSQISFALPLAVMFGSTDRLPDPEGLFMDRLRNTVLRECILDGKQYVVIGLLRNLVVLDHCTYPSSKKFGQLQLGPILFDLEQFDAAAAEQLVQKHIARPQILSKPLEGTRKRWQFWK
jgi:hypothetical protein